MKVALTIIDVVINIALIYVTSCCHLYVMLADVNVTPTDVNIVLTSERRSNKCVYRHRRHGDICKLLPHIKIALVDVNIKLTDFNVFPTSKRLFDNSVFFLTIVVLTYVNNILAYKN